jgi:arginine utilization protein RocB
MGDHGKCEKHSKPGTKERFYGSIDKMLKEYYGVPVDEKTRLVKASEMLSVRLPPDHPMHSLEWKKGIKEVEDEFEPLSKMFRKEYDEVVYIKKEQKGHVPFPVTWISYSKYLSKSRKNAKK